METTTVDLAQNFSNLGLGEGWSWDKGSWWLQTPDGFDVRWATKRLLELEARFVAITATPQTEGGEVRLDYQWDLNGQLLSFTTASRDKKIATIVDLSPAVDWAERETYDYFAVEFTGRSSTAPLMLRTGDAPGVHLQKEAAQ
jgi:hypothetical protein